MTEDKPRHDFKLKFLAATFPSGEVEEHEIVITNAPDDVHVIGLFNGIMNAPTSKLLEITEVTENDDITDIRSINYPKGRG